MSLSPGTKLAHYAILESIGKGGMGEVYRASDEKLGRDVAIKVLPDEFARDKERLIRLEREARLLAALNHPNVATLHGFEESGGRQFLVMELVEGETLAERIARGPIPFEAALPLFRQIAEGLEAAHGKGIVHRDLKPGNVKITPDGHVKVLDFGLAKSHVASESFDLSSSPTRTRDATQNGMLLGTAAYMSPEQARGEATDARTDVWAFGICLFESLTAESPFGGTSVTETLASILRDEPNWQALPESTPLSVRALLRRCLRKDLRGRLQHIGDARIEIEEASTEPEATAEPAPAQRYPLASVALMMIVTAVVAGAAVWFLKPAAPLEIGRYEFHLPSDTAITQVFHQTLAISPDGKRIVYAAERDGVRQLYLRDVDRFDAVPIQGTEGAAYVIFSPDGENIAFFKAGELQKVSLRGGEPITICQTRSSPRGGAWGSDDTIVFSDYGEGLKRVSANGGTPEVIAIPDWESGEKIYSFPQFVPGGEWVIYTIGTYDDTFYDDAHIAVVSLQTGERKTVLEGGAYGRVLPTGHLVYGRAGSLMAVRFDVRRLEVRGQPLPVLEPIVTWPASGAAQFSISATGTLVYLPGPLHVGSRLVWVDRAGAVQPLLATTGSLARPRLSPDGNRIALTYHAGNDYIALYDVERDALTRFTLEGNSASPVWSPDGEWLAFDTDSQTGWHVFRKRADGSGTAEQLVSGAKANSWSPDGKLLAISKDRDLWTLPLPGDGTLRPFLETPYHENGAVFSPDGRFIAYQSFETGRWEVYVRPFPGPGERIQISTEGGNQPRWNPRGGELFYRNGDQLMAVDIETDPKLRAGRPQLLFEAPYKPNYDVARDGQKFLMIVPEEDTSSQINVVLNWVDELKRLVPAE